MLIPGGIVGCINGCIGRCDMVGAGAAGEYASGVVGGQQSGGPTTNLLGIGRRILLAVPGDDPVVVDVGIGGVGRGGGARSLNSAALHCSNAPGMCSKCVASSTL